ncbi:meprin A subunit beta-like [Notolabrus celidotus]|uniref:meprin A subunit beta-like n=1 Tax=Notolabrus celidotus TaxID=1203425 RepID=UPI00148F890B|nr:meprin A subunit beta-like [Notolabrus celidotus]
MKGFIFFVVNLALSSAIAPNKKGPEIVDIGEEKNIAEANKDSVRDDILVAPSIQRSATNNDDILWPSPVPYVLDSSLDMNAKGVIMRAFDQFRLKSCIDFRERTSDEYYIKAQKLNGCFSYVGRVITDGQDLSIGQNCDSISTVEHEFLHALGFNHEQSRYDRDDFVTINFENIIQDFVDNFDKVSSEFSTTNGVPYDYMSVMHYGEDYFSNGNGSTIITKDPIYQDVIGQRLEMSPSDVKELNLRYQCKSSVAFQMYCGFTEGNMCEMASCSQNGRGWEMSSYVKAGPTSDHTNLLGGNKKYSGKTNSEFMHASTASGKEGDSAWLETKTMSPKRDCNVQCLQFYYFHSGHESDELNIWIREFDSQKDIKGTARLVGQITGPGKPHWQLKHISLNATKDFQVEFEARKGAGKSEGGFSIDDINLSEIECPHVTLQLDDFEKLLNTSDFGTEIRSKYDNQLEWPVPQRQVTFQMVDQTPNIQLQMSQQRSTTSDQSKSNSGKLNWGNPSEGGTPTIDENNEIIYSGPLIGRYYFASLEDMKNKQYLKGGSAIFVFSFQDLTPLVKGSTLPCPQMRPVQMKPSPARDGPCFSGIVTPTYPPPPPRTTEDGSIFGFSPGLVPCTLLTFLLALMLLMR